MRLDGLDPMVMSATGAHTGHATIAMRFDGVLYVVESTDSWYWPVQRIQRTLFKEWIRSAINCDYHVTHLPLSDEMRAKFNLTAAQEFFFKTEGLPYGYHNFMSSYIDTPEDNYPSLMPNDLMPTLFAMLEKSHKNTTDMFFTEAMNKHLGTKGLDIPGVAAEAAKRGLNIS